MKQLTSKREKKMSPTKKSILGYQCTECNMYCKPDQMSARNPNVCFDCDPTVEDDGQPSWEQEWIDFGEVYDDDPNTI